jgi:UDP-N-acetylmuramoyl-tripeptide--D-alanyl-D-alanine ligase
MKIWDAKQAEKATGGKLIGATDWEVFGISIDTRLVKKGDLFIAIKGTRVDGHDYIREAFIKGATAVMVERMPANFPTTSPILQVDNCLKALTKLAESRRAETKAHLTAVTGSVGKTSTKEMLNIVFSNFGITHATIGNNNNDIGAPLTLARMPLDAEYGIYELGMNHSHEITPLSKLVKPHAAIITTVEEVHIENFENIEGIAAAKAEIFDGMDSAGTAILNADNQFFEFLSKAAKRKGIQNIISFGRASDANIRLIEHRDNAKDSFVHASVFGKELGYTLSARGIHMALNSLSVLGAVHAAGLDIIEAASALSSFSGTAGRGQILHINKDGKNITLIDDSYNASPVSMRAALNNLGAIDAKGRRIAVIGDMLELGEKSAQLHESLLNDIIHNGIDLVFTVGKTMKLLFNKLPEKIRGEAVDNADEVLPLLESSLKDNDMVLVKASHGIRLDKVVTTLQKVKQDAI